jgi:hypothetical protein
MVVVGAATDKFAILALTAGLTQTVPIAPRTMGLSSISEKPGWGQNGRTSFTAYGTSVSNSPSRHHSSFKRDSDADSASDIDELIMS